MNKSSTNIDIFKLSSGLRCKPGDLAIIRKSLYPQNIGRIVEVVRVSDIFDDGPLYWLIRANGKPLLAIGSVSNKFLGYFREIHCPDSALTPITGLPLIDSTEQSDLLFAKRDLATTREVTA